MIPFPWTAGCWASIFIMTSKKKGLHSLSASPMSSMIFSTDFHHRVNSANNTNLPLDCHHIFFSCVNKIIVKMIQDFHIDVVSISWAKKTGQIGRWCDVMPTTILHAFDRRLWKWCVTYWRGGCWLSSYRINYWNWIRRWHDVVSLVKRYMQCAQASTTWEKLINHNRWWAAVRHVERYGN